MIPISMALSAPTATPQPPPRQSKSKTSQLMAEWGDRRELEMYVAQAHFRLAASSELCAQGGCAQRHLLETSTGGPDTSSQQSVALALAFVYCLMSYINSFQTLTSLSYSAPCLVDLIS